MLKLWGPRWSSSRRRIAFFQIPGMAGRIPAGLGGDKWVGVIVDLSLIVRITILGGPTALEYDDRPGKEDVWKRWKTLRVGHMHIRSGH